MAVLDELKVIVARLRGEQPGAVELAPEVDEKEGGLGGVPVRHPPFSIWLAPWASAIAGELHQQFGDDIKLQVGGLPYPISILDTAPPPPPAGPSPQLLDPHEIAAWLAGPAVVRSGHTLQHSLLVRNLTGRDLQIATSGPVEACVVDPSTGEVVGLVHHPGFRILPLDIVRVPPGQTGQIPLLIGTASCTPRLGYAVPPGDWAVQATLMLGDRRDSPRRRTPVLPLTITA